MDSQYYTSYSDESQIPVTITLPMDVPYATCIPQHNSPALGYSPYLSSDPSYGNLVYSNQSFPGQPTRSNSYSSNQLEIPAEYYQEVGQDELDEMPESERALARERRKAQNRAAQKAFRRRKESRIRELEQKLGTLQHDYKGLESAFEDLKGEKEQVQSNLEKLMEENASLRNSIESSPASVTDLNWWPLTMEDSSGRPFSEVCGSLSGMDSSKESSRARDLGRV